MRTITSTKIGLGVIAALATILAQPAVKAQTVTNTVVANIPFDFQIGSKHLAAGKYRIEEESNILWVKGDSGSAAMLVLKDSENKPTDSAVVFHHYGNQYFLREVRDAGTSEKLWCSETKAEHRAKLEEDALNPNSGPRGDSKVEIALLAPPR